MLDDKVISIPELSELSFEHLRIHYLTGRSHSTKVGRYREHTYTNFALTDLGEIEMSRWSSLAEQLISYHNEEGLQAQLLEWVTEHYLFCRTAAERRQKSLDLHISRIFDDPLWVDYVPFNQKCRPDVLASAELIRVQTVCCDEPGITTREQVEQAKQGTRTICCPNCGRFSEFAVLDGKDVLRTADEHKEHSKRTRGHER